MGDSLSCSDRNPSLGLVSDSALLKGVVVGRVPANPLPRLVLSLGSDESITRLSLSLASGATKDNITHLENKRKTMICDIHVLL